MAALGPELQPQQKAIVLVAAPAAVMVINKQGSYLEDDEGTGGLRSTSQNIPPASRRTILHMCWYMSTLVDLALPLCMPINDLDECILLTCTLRPGEDLSPAAMLPLF